MPSHTIHSTLTQMYHDIDGAPWNFADWKELTGINHGLFPKVDHQLPVGWTRQTSTDISSYFDEFRAITTASERIKFASQNPKKDVQLVPGRKAWRDWVTKLWKNCRIHEKIIDILLTENLHPFHIIAQDPTAGWPDADFWIGGVIDPVGTSLFGEDAWFPGVERLHSKLRPTVKELIQRTWIVLYNLRLRSEDRLSALKSKAIEAFEDLDHGKLTKKKIQTVLVKVVRWKELAEALEALYDRDERIDEMKGELDTLMAGLGLNIQTSPKKPRLCRVTKATLKSLATEEDISDILNLYRACFDSACGDTSVFEQRPVIYKYGGLAENADLGVEVESTLSYVDLTHNLGFFNGAPLLFNTHRHIGGLTPWDDPTAFEAANQDDAFLPLSMRWHQLAGVHAILRRLLSKEPTSRDLGVLIADEVGLGKTLQSMAVIATLTEYIGRQGLMALDQQPSPNISPLLYENPYLGDSKDITIAPHLIIVPGTVLGQWHTELKVALRPKSFDIFVYTTGQNFRNDFWSEQGPFAQSMQPPSSKIILASHTALTQDYNLLHVTQKAPLKEPWKKAMQVSQYDSLVGATLFNLNYLTVIIDEAHQFRNTGSKHSAALSILEKAKTRLIMTATPLHTSTRDLAGMGRLVGIPHFFTMKAMDEDRNDQAELRRSKASLDEDHDPLDVEQNEDDPVRETQVKIARRMQGQFDQRILRRTVDSKNWEGEALISLPPCHEHIVVLRLQPSELEIHAKLAVNLREKLSSCSTAKMFSSSFYLPSRMGAVYPRLNLEDKIPRFSTIEDWDKRKSTKVDICVKMCLHLLSRDDASMMEFKDGQVFFPKTPPPVHEESLSRLNKVLIYQEFPSFGPLVHDVFNLYKIPYLYMDGDTSFEQRAKMVKRFDNDLSIRVLFFTSVGSSGLNLSVANHLIFLDQPWSSQDVRQIRGRAHRQPQKKEVHCYHLLADETSDIVLSVLARGKKDMMETFLQRLEGQELYDLFTKGVALGHDLEDHPDGTQVVASKAKNDTSARTSMTVVTVKRAADDSSTQPPITKGKKRKTTATKATDDGIQGEPSITKGKKRKTAATKATEDGIQGEPSITKGKKRKTAATKATIAKPKEGAVVAKMATNDSTQATQDKSAIENQTTAIPIAMNANDESPLANKGEVKAKGTRLEDLRDVPTIPSAIVDVSSSHWSVMSTFTSSEGRHVPSTPRPEISHRQRGDFQEEESSPEVRKERKRARLLISHSSLPENASRQASPESDTNMNHPVDSELSPLQDVSTVNRRASIDSDASTAPVKSKEQFGYTANKSSDSLSIGSYSGDERCLLAPKETDKMKVALQKELHKKAATQPMGAEEKQKKEHLQKFKYSLLGAASGPSTHRLSSLPQQSGALSNDHQMPRLRGLSPPPRSAPSRNPFLNGKNKRPSMPWKLP